MGLVLRAFDIKALAERGAEDTRSCSIVRTVHHSKWPMPQHFEPPGDPDSGEGTLHHFDTGRLPQEGRDSRQSTRGILSLVSAIEGHEDFAEARTGNLDIHQAPAQGQPILHHSILRTCSPQFGCTCVVGCVGDDGLNGERHRPEDHR